jgi:hypothetical protein
MHLSSMSAVLSLRTDLVVLTLTKSLSYQAYGKLSVELPLKGTTTPVQTLLSARTRSGFGFPGGSDLFPPEGFAGTPTFNR